MGRRGGGWQAVSAPPPAPPGPPPPGPTSGRGILAPLRHRDYRLLAAGMVVSLLGDGFFRVAIALQVYALDNDPRALSAVAAVWMGTQVLVLPVGGWVTDHVERRKVMIAADLWRCGAMVGIGGLSVAGELALWHLLVLGGCFGAGNAFFNPAATSLVPELLPDEDLPRANALLGVVKPLLLWIVGPLAGGLVIALTGPGPAILFDGATFLASAVLLGFLATRPVTTRTRASFREVLREAAGGWHFVRRAPWAWAWLAATALSTLLWHGPFDVLVPYLLLNDFGLDVGEAGRAMSVILAAGGLGSIVVSTVIGRQGLPRRFVTAMYVTETVGLCGLVVFGVMTALWQAALAGLLLHTAFAVNEIIWTTTLQRFVPRGVLGRVSSLDWMVGIGLAPLSFAVTGPLAVAVGARPVLAGAGLLGATGVLGLSLVPGARSPEQQPSPVAPVAGNGPGVGSSDPGRVEV